MRSSASQTSCFRSRRSFVPIQQLWHHVVWDVELVERFSSLSLCANSFAAVPSSGASLFPKPTNALALRLKLAVFALPGSCFV